MLRSKLFMFQSIRKKWSKPILICITCFRELNASLVDALW